MTEQLLMVDLSSNNATPNLKRHFEGGYRVLGLKATEDTDYAWDEGEELAGEWHELGGIVVHYHFTRPGSGRAQADHFLGVIKDRFARGDQLAVDVEVEGVNGRSVTAFINRCHEVRPHAPGLVYGPPYFLRDNGIRPAHDWRLWLASYTARIPFIPPGWDTWTIWQFTSQGTGLPGITGAVDHNKIRRSMLAHVPRPLTAAERERLVRARHTLNGHHRPFAAVDKPLIESVREAAHSASHRH